MKEVHSLCCMICHLDSERHRQIWNELIVQQLIEFTENVSEWEEYSYEKR